MNKSLSIISFLISTMSIHSATAQDTSALNYDYFDVGVAIAKSKVDFLSKNFEFKTKAAAITGSYRVSESLYIFGGAEKTKTDDTDANGILVLRVDNKSTSLKTGLGLILPLTSSTAIITELGARNHNSKTNSIFGTLPAQSERYKETDLLFSVGIRSYFDDGYELAAKITKVGDFQQIEIGGPMYINNSTAIDIGYVHSKDKTSKNTYKASGVTASVRFHF